MKNPYIKIPPKSPPTNFQSLCIFKNLIFIQKSIFLHFRPNRPADPAVAHLFFLTGRSPSPHWASTPRPTQPTHASVAPYLVAAFLTGEAPPATLPLLSLRARLTGGPHLSSLTSGPPELGRATTTSHRSPHCLFRRIRIWLSRTPPVIFRGLPRPSFRGVPTVLHGSTRQVTLNILHL
jgi:hypothetical protein